MLAGAVAAGLVLWKWSQPTPSPLPTEAPAPEPAPPVVSESSPHLSELAPAPDWSSLDPWQSTMTRDAFIQLMETVYCSSRDWQDDLILGTHDVLIQTGISNRPYQLHFARRAATPTRPWRAAHEFPPAPPSSPLEGVRIAIDPGHIGGKWAPMEERWFRIGEGTPVAEGDLTLQVARRLQPLLEDLGAEILLVRSNGEPVTSSRPESFLEEARTSVLEVPTTLAERLFYRTAEIRARAEKIRQWQPDLVVCLHFNAEPWGDPANPALVQGHHLHLLVNGAYSPEEMALDDQRFHLLRRLLDGSHAEETAASLSIIEAFTEQTDLPPFLYETNSARAVNVAGNPYLWGRNLLANRIYAAPVVYLEPYVMNSVEDYTRIQAGDYEGEREVDGKLQPSIFHEYARAVADGLARHYRRVRPQMPPAPESGP
ncbi:N-acetylmuramoyl-L-alanine amidase family protein [Haloferula luteola]|nr:N-acetylmuramoyl-L-alanine amidase [Haloferula luteola]